MRQGGLSSPRLFNLYINDLIAELGSMHVGCRLDGVSCNNISYADDLMLLGPSPACETFAAANRLVYNAIKMRVHGLWGSW